MQLFELFATLGLDAGPFDSGLSKAMESMKRAQDQISAALPHFRAQAGSIKSALAAAFDLSHVAVRWPNVSGAAAALPSRAVGMEYVPYDGYVARLHAGERILTKVENQQLARGEKGAQPYDLANLGSVVAEAVQSAMSGVTVSIDGQAAGRILASPVSREIARQAYQGRY